MQTYKITVKGDKEEWRYNLYVMCEAMRDGERVYFDKYRDEVAPIGSKLTSCPDSFKNRGAILFESASADTLSIFICAIPHSLPEVKYIGDAPESHLHLVISSEEGVVCNRHISLNPWSGCNFDLTL